MHQSASAPALQASEASPADSFAEPQTVPESGPSEITTTASTTGLAHARRNLRRSRPSSPKPMNYSTEMESGRLSCFAYQRALRSATRSLSIPEYLYTAVRGE